MTFDVEFFAPNKRDAVKLIQNSECLPASIQDFLVAAVNALPDPEMTIDVVAKGHLCTGPTTISKSTAELMVAYAPRIYVAT